MHEHSESHVCDPTYCHTLAIATKIFEYEPTNSIHRQATHPRYLTDSLIEIDRRGVVEW